MALDIPKNQLGLAGPFKSVVLLRRLADLRTRDRAQATPRRTARLTKLEWIVGAMMANGGCHDEAAPFISECIEPVGMSWQKLTGVPRNTPVPNIHSIGQPSDAQGLGIAPVETPNYHRSRRHSDRLQGQRTQQCAYITGPIFF